MGEPSLSGRRRGGREAFGCFWHSESRAAERGCTGYYRIAVVVRRRLNRTTGAFHNAGPSTNYKLDVVLIGTHT